MRGLAAACLTVSISLFSGCAKAPAPIETPAICARPAKPSLPKLGKLEFLESREAYTLIKLRDSTMRNYIAALEDALDCYEKQTGEN